jgi:hypothetical protein
VKRHTFRVQVRRGPSGQETYQSIRGGIRRYAGEQLKLADLLSELNRDPVADHRSQHPGRTERDHADSINHQVWLATLNGVLKRPPGEEGPIHFESARTGDTAFTITYQPGAPAALTVQRNSRLLARTPEERHGRRIVR